MENLKHFARTLLQIAMIAVFVTVVVAVVIFVAVVVLKLSPETTAYVVLISLGLTIGGYVYWSARWHAYWAPISKPVITKKWTDSADHRMETVVENAIVQAGEYVRSSTLRVSIYNRTTGRRLARTVVGETAEFLGLHGIGMWFYIPDRFHARIDGLVCLDPQTGRWIYHVPKSEIRGVNRVAGKGKFSVDRVAEDNDGETDPVIIQLSEVRPNLR